MNALTTSTPLGTLGLASGDPMQRVSAPNDAWLSHIQDKHLRGS